MISSKINHGQPITLGILGGGQLAKMLANSAYQLGINIAIIENSSNSPAGEMTKMEFPKGWNEISQLDKFIEISDIITLENEFIDPTILEYIEKKRKVFPNSNTIKLIQDKYIQKKTFSNAGIKVPIFNKIDSIEDAHIFAANHGYPFLLKTRKLGYDGYGNFTVNNHSDIQLAFDKFKNVPNFAGLLAEAFVNYSKELAVMIARNENEDFAVYPCVETIQKNHICHTVHAPADIDEAIIAQAQQIALQCVQSVDGVGMFGVELFLLADQSLLVNEIAPRPHNSGHYSIEACECSQFENTIRAVCNLPLGSTDMLLKNAVMVNLLGERDGIGVPEDISDALKVKGAHLHLYNKKQSRIGRKMGHITALGDSLKEATLKAYRAADLIKW